MSTVDRIESTAEKTDIHEPLVSSFAGSIGKLNISILIPNQRSLRDENLA
jgi:hypothetical protein